MEIHRGVGSYDVMFCYRKEDDAASDARTKPTSLLCLCVFSELGNVCKSTSTMRESLVHSKQASNKPCGAPPLFLHQSLADCHGGFLGGSLARGHVGLESPLCDIGYCPGVLAGCWAHTHTHMSHEDCVVQLMCWCRGFSLRTS